MRCVKVCQRRDEAASSREVIALTLADLDFLGLAVVRVIDREMGKVTRDVAVRPLGLGLALPSRADRGQVEFEQGRVRLAFADDTTDVRLAGATRSIAVDVQVKRPPNHQTLGVAVAWPGSGGRRFAYSSKHTALPARGTITVRGQTRHLASGALACLDWGRGVWPHRSSWNWASAAGSGVGLNLGARWTDGGFAPDLRHVAARRGGLRLSFVDQGVARSSQNVRSSPFPFTGIIPRSVHAKPGPSARCVAALS